MARSPGWGPDRRRGALAITFDNLGEAADLQRGRWLTEQPLGRHDSVTQGLPLVLERLAGRGLPATFFVEGINAAFYPEALASIAGHGHELALHGWRHEPWARLDETEERELLGQGVEALQALGLRPQGFRPPGGALIPSSWDALAGAGFSYCSPAGAGAGVRHGLAVLPFDWTLLDAFHYLPHFATRRRDALGSAEELAPPALRARVGEAVAHVARQGGLLVLLFHPFLVDSAQRLGALEAVLDDVRARVDAGALWCAPMCELAAWMRREGNAEAWDLSLETD